MATREHISQLGCTGFHRNSQDLNLIQKGVALPRETEREEGRGGEEAAHREERSTGEVAGGSPPVKGDGR